MARERGIAESRVETDAGLILEAAGQAVTLWPDDSPGAPNGVGD
jgi:hypothetical protein